MNLKENHIQELPPAKIDRKYIETIAFPWVS